MGKCKPCGCYSHLKREQRCRKANALPKVTPAISKAGNKTFALWLPVPSTDTKAIPKCGLPAAPSP